MRDSLERELCNVYTTLYNLQQLKTRVKLGQFLNLPTAILMLSSTNFTIDSKLRISLASIKEVSSVFVFSKFSTTLLVIYALDVMYPGSVVASLSPCPNSFDSGFDLALTISTRTISGHLLLDP